MLLLLLAGLNGAAILALRGFAWVEGGLDRAACSAEELLGAALSGRASPPFVGVSPLLDTLRALDGTLADTSGTWGAVDAIVNRTANVSQAVAMASRTLQLLRATAADPANLEPRRNGSGASLLHRCRFCADLPRLLDPAITALEAGAAAALAGAREAVAVRLSPAARESLRLSLRSSTGPLEGARPSAQRALKFFSGGGFGQFRERARSWQFWALAPCLAMVIAAFLLFGCGCSSWLLFVAVGKAAGRGCGGSYNNRVAGCAFCSCFSGFWYVLFACIAGGLILAASASWSGACLALEGLDGKGLFGVAPALGMDLAGDQGALVADFFDLCMKPNAAPGPSSADADALRAVFARDGGARVTLRQRLGAELADPLEASFGRLQSAAPQDLAGHPAVLRLREWLRTARVDALVLADAPAMRATAPFADLSLDPRGSDGLELGLGASAACSDYNASAGPGPSATSLAGAVVPGVQAFADRLLAYGPEVPGPQPAPGCARAVACGSQPNASSARACAAGNAYMDLKRELWASGSFRCNLFQFPDGSLCDPLGMRWSGSGWSGDCLGPGGAPGVKEVPCTLAQFAQYVAEFDGRLGAVLERLDRTALEARVAIVSELQALVRAAVLSPLGAALGAGSCGFIAGRYLEVMDGLCYEGAFGLWVLGWGHVACGAITALLTLLAYGIWLEVGGFGLCFGGGEIEKEEPHLHVRRVIFDTDVEDLDATPRDKIMRYSPKPMTYGSGVGAVQPQPVKLPR